MDHLKNYKAFVSAVEVGEYRNNIGIMTCILSSIALIGSLAIDINAFSVCGSVIGVILMAMYVVLLIKKDLKKILLFECLQGMLLTLLLCIILTSLQFNTAFYTFAMIFVIASLVISLSAGYLIVKSRLKRNYYGTAQTNASDILTVPGIAVFAGAVGHFGGKLVSKTPADFSHTISLLFAGIVAVFFGFKCMESLLRHIVVCKYDLYNYIRIRSATELHL